MDKKNFLMGTLFAAVALAAMFYSAKHAPQPANAAAVTAASAPTAAPISALPAPSGASSNFVTATIEASSSKTTDLENAYITVTLSDVGGAIRNVALAKYPRELHSPLPFVMNSLHKDPLMAFVDVPGLDRQATYQLVTNTGSEAIYRTVWNKQIEVTRRYQLSPDAPPNNEPYLLHVETTFRNLTDQAVTLPALPVALGTAAPVNTADNGIELSSYSYSGGNLTKTTRPNLEPHGPIFGMFGAGHGAVPEVQTPGPLQWAAVSNQFFVSIFTPDTPATGLVTRRIKLLTQQPDEDPHAYGVTADAVFNLPPIAPHATATLGGSLYVGPKEYHRLGNVEVFKLSQDRVELSGWWIIRFCSALLLTLLGWMHSLVSNWGVAIVLTTLLLKFIFVPFTLAQSRSAKRMQKVQPEMKAIKEKYKDNAQKQQAAMLELYKTHRINPAGSCLPMLITLPFFWAFFYMLRSAAELRFQPFLWATDLSSPDTVGHAFGLAINLFPILLGIVSFINVRVTPQPSVDNSQRTMMLMTPVMMLFFYYTYACALSVYSLVNTVFSIGQQLVINRMKDTQPPVPAVAGGRGAGGKALKNVTPRRK
ncbi:MAG TPA: membrane protein insertase YidC [Opitutaceae bacterium]